MCPTGIPSVCVGSFMGGGAHTRQEYLRADSLKSGLGIALDLVLGYCRDDDGEEVWSLLRPEDEGDSDSFDAWCASRGLEFSKLQDWRIDGRNYQEARRRIERSWTRLLGVDRNAGFGGDWSKRTLQATFWELKRDQVLSHELFMPRADATGR